ncbi:MAG: hypothetical protein V8R43_08430 [Dorea sp.]
MVRKYSKEELKNKLHRALYTVVMNEGIEGVTVRKISKTSDLSDPYIYQCYKNLGDLMADAFLEIDRKVAQLVEELLGDGEFRKKMESNPEECCWTMWNAYWKFLMKDRRRRFFTGDIISPHGIRRNFWRSEEVCLASLLHIWRRWDRITESKS